MRLLEITKQIYDGVRQSYLTHNVFCANTLRKGLAKDNLDVNARSNFIKSHFHGTSIAVLQNVTQTSKGQPLSVMQPSTSRISNARQPKKLAQLLEQYAS